MRLPGLRQVTIASSVTAIELARLFLEFASYLRESLEPILANPRSLSSVQSGIVLTGGTARVVSHKLQLPTGKTPNGWAVTDINAAATVRRTAWDSKTITLIASATCTVQLEVW